MPGRLSINASSKKFGVNMCCYEEWDWFWLYYYEYRDNTTAEYLVKDPKYHYKWVSVTAKEVNDYAVFFKTGNYTYVISRVDVTSHYGFEYYQAGLTLKGLLTFYYNPETYSKDQMNDLPIDILTCSTTEIVAEPEPEGLCS